VALPDPVRTPAMPPDDFDVRTGYEAIQTL
jgi:hypothetical protein